ncbi:hypothetical protein KAH27_05085 [bacterium]|nr:hypothetical protein [bacterium]
MAVVLKEKSYLFALRIIKLSRYLKTINNEKFIMNNEKQWIIDNCYLPIA